MPVLCVIIIHWDLMKDETMLTRVCVRLGVGGCMRVSVNVRECVWLDGCMRESVNVRECV